MPASRYLLLIAGILGVFAMFRPMIGLGHGPLRVEVSAYELSFGLAKTHKLLDRKVPALAAKHLPADVLQTRDDIKLVADASRGAALAYIPAALLLVLGAFAVWRKRTGRVEAVLAIVLALASIAAWLGVRFGVAYGIEEEPALGRLHLEMRLAAHMLLVVGVLAIAAAAKVLFKRDE